MTSLQTINQQQILQQHKIHYILSSFLQKNNNCMDMKGPNAAYLQKQKREWTFHAECKQFSNHSFNLKPYRYMGQNSMKEPYEIKLTS